MATNNALATVPDTAIDLFSPDEVEKFDTMAKDLSAIERHLSGMAVTTQDQAVSLTKGLGELKRLKDTCESARKAMVTPLNAQVKVINGTWARIVDAVDKLDQTARHKYRVWKQGEDERIAREQAAARRRQEEATRKEQEALAKAAAANNSRTRTRALEDARKAGTALAEARLAEPMDAPRGIKTDEGSAFTRMEWKFRVMNPLDVTREFLCVDEKKIRAAVAQGVRDIKGVAIYEEENVTVRVG